MKTAIFGIDPGVSGGIAYFYEEERIAWPMPVIKAGKTTMFDGDGIREILRYAGRGIRRVYLERAQAMPKQGVVAMFNYGQGYGFLKGIIDTLQIPLEIVRPADWHRDICKGYPGDKPKEKALVAAVQMFPDVNLLATPRSKKPHEGIIDALLIAEYGRRRYSGGSQG